MLSEKVKPQESEGEPAITADELFGQDPGFTSIISAPTYEQPRNRTNHTLREKPEKTPVSGGRVILNVKSSNQI